MTSSQDFLGVGWAFPPTFRPESRSVELASDVADIRQSLEILLSTTIGERLLHPTYGCDLRRYLFEPLSATVAGLIQETVTTAILYHEPRIRPESIRLEQPPNEGTLYLHIDYLVRATNSRGNFVFDFYKTEGTELPS